MHSSVSMRLCKVCHLAHIMLQIHFVLLGAQPAIENTFFVYNVCCSVRPLKYGNNKFPSSRNNTNNTLQIIRVALNLMEYVVIFFPAYREEVLKFSCHLDGPHKLCQLQSARSCCQLLPVATFIEPVLVYKILNHHGQGRVCLSSMHRTHFGKFHRFV